MSTSKRNPGQVTLSTWGSSQHLSPHPNPKALQPWDWLSCPSPSFSFLCKSAIWATFSPSPPSPSLPLGLLAPDWLTFDSLLPWPLGSRLLSWSACPLPISPLLSPLMVRFSLDPYQMPLAVVSLISTIKHVSSTISRNGHVLIFIQWVTCPSHK